MVMMKSPFFAVVVLLVGTFLVEAQDKSIAPFAKDAVTKGWDYFHKGDLDTALKRFNQATIIDPNFAPGYFGMAYVYSVQNKLDLAIENYQKSIALDSTYPPAYSNLGLALLYSGKPKEALPMLEKAVKMDPKDGDAQVNLALYYFGQKDYSASWTHIHKAQDLKAKIQKEFVTDLKSKMSEPPRDPKK